MREHKYKVDEVVRDVEEWRFVRIVGQYTNGAPHVNDEPVYKVEDIGTGRVAQSRGVEERHLGRIPTLDQIRNRGYDVIKGPDGWSYLIRRGDMPQEGSPSFPDTKAVLLAARLWGDGTVGIDPRAIQSPLHD